MYLDFCSHYLFLSRHFPSSVGARVCVIRQYQLVRYIEAGNTWRLEVVANRVRGEAKSGFPRRRWRTQWGTCWGAWIFWRGSFIVRSVL